MCILDCVINFTSHLQLLGECSFWNRVCHAEKNTKNKQNPNRTKTSERSSEQRLSEELDSTYLFFLTKEIICKLQWGIFIMNRHHLNVCINVLSRWWSPAQRWLCITYVASIWLKWKWDNRISQSFLFFFSVLQCH